MKVRDYSVEFYETLDIVIKKCIAEWQSINAAALLIGVHEVNIPIANMLFLILGKYRTDYNDWRKSGISQQHAVDRIYDVLKPYANLEYESSSSLVKYKVTHHPWYKKLIPYKGHLLIYIFDEFQLEYFIPLITALNQPILLLSEYNLPEDVDLPDQVTAVTLEFTKIRLYSNTFIESKFPLIYHYFNSLDVLIQILSPKGILVAGGHHQQEKVLSIVGNSYGIPSIVIQQGWPRLLHSMFRELPYTHFFTWGEAFNKQLKAYNPIPKFHSVGYLNSVGKFNKMANRCVTFFLQPHVSVVDDTPFQELLLLVEVVANSFPQLNVLVHEHPKYKHNKEIVEKWQMLPNVEFVSEEKLLTIFNRTLISVSHFSSALLEGLVHNCIPLVYNSNTRFDSSPDITENRCGIVTSNPEDFLQSMKNIMEEPDRYISAITSYRTELFSDVQSDAVRRAVSLINRLIMPCDYLREEKMPRLHIGCGAFPIEGWLNVDKSIQLKMVSYMDASQIFPFADKSFCYIFAEHLFEHLDLEGALNMLKECHRVLRPQGVLRLSMPDLNFLIDLYLHPEMEIHRKYIDWSVRNFMPEIVKLYPDGNFLAMYVLNNFYRAWGHQLIYDEQGIVQLLSKCSFDNIYFCQPGESKHFLLKGIDQHHFSIPEWANKLETMVVEARKKEIV